jgi:hypothetical protein
MAIEMRYGVVFYDGPISDKKAVNSFEPSSAPYTFSIGDFVDPSGWGGKNQLSANEHYQITAVEHQLSLVDTPEDQYGQHNLAISVIAIPR